MLENPEQKRPTFRSAVSSTTLLSNLLFSGLLAATCFMPSAVGCDRKTTISPIDVAKSPIDGLDDAAFAVLMLWPYFFGAACAVLLVVIAIVRPRRLGRWLLPVPLAFQVVLTTMGAVAVVSADDRESRQFASIFFLLPSAAVLAVSCIAMRRRGSFVAAVRGTSGLSVLASFGIYFDTLLMHATRFLYGFYLSMVAVGGMLFSSWILYTRGERCLSDQNAPLRPAQFGIRALLVWTSVVAVLITGYQVVLVGDKQISRTTEEQVTNDEAASAEPNWRSRQNVTADKTVPTEHLVPSETP